MPEWLAIDGEGVGKLPHRYVLMADSDGDHLYDARGLASAVIFSWLLDRAGYRLCGYFLSYDITMWLRDLPDRSIHTLMRPGLRRVPGGGFSRVRYRRFKLHYLSRMLEISDGKRTVRVWDLGPYYQKAFVTACEQSGIELPAYVANMKNARGTKGWGRKKISDITRYCVTECRALKRLAEGLESTLDEIGIRPTVWHGPGSVAGVALRERSILDYRGEHEPIAVTDDANRAFFGGRFEHSILGHRSKVYGYDITSAYPDQIARLPCLAHGSWKKLTRPSDIERALARGDTACLHVEVGDSGNPVWGPFPVRVSRGSVVFPRGNFRTWVWADEYRAAIEGGWTNIRILYARTLRRVCRCEPFAWVRDLFAQRAISTGGKRQALKLVLNSIYGKLAQRVGEPKYASPVWAGLITSGTRAEILRMISRHRDPSHVFGIATDGVFSSERIACPKTPGLGEWGRTDIGEMTFVRSGVYWGGDMVKARGMGARTLRAQIPAIRRAIEAGSERVDLGTRIVFGGARATVWRSSVTLRYKRSRAYGEWHDAPCTISLLPGPKRGPSWGPPDGEGRVSLAYGSQIPGNLAGLHDLFRELNELLQ